MIPDDKQIKSRMQLNEWLSYELPRYCERFGMLRYYLHFSESGVLYQHQRLLRNAEYHKNCGGGGTGKVVLF